LLVAANIVPSSQILVTLMMEAIGSSEMLGLTRGTRRTIQEDDIKVIIIIIIIIIIITGTTALFESWPSSGFLNNLIFTL
jgi:hypothetical protein